MKKFLVGSVASTLLICGAAYVALAHENPPATENAQVTFTVKQFRSLSSPSDNGYIDALTALAPHPAVTLADEDGLPTLHVKRAVNIEISVDSADGTESYTPLGVYFEQRTDGPNVKKDPDGKINFAQWRSNNGTVVINNKFIHQGRDGRYEFFVIVRRASDGEIGIIDPAITNDYGDEN
jgi:hypothetical protein